MNAFLRSSPASSAPIDAITLHLRRVDHIDFRCSSEETQYNKYAARLHLKGNDCVIVVSRGGKVSRFLFGSVTFDNNGIEVVIIRARTYRISAKSNATWSALMIQNYAHKVGIHFDNVKMFEQHFKEMQERKRTGTRVMVGTRGKAKMKMKMKRGKK